MKRIMIDAAKCDGCKNCSIACMNAHRLDTDDQNIYTLNPADTMLETRNFIRKNPNGGYLPIFCRHCDSPDCANGCMSGALNKDPETGLVQYDGAKCGHCFMCVMNCPFGLPKPDRNSKSYVIKCDFCKDHGGEPSCVKACPKKAITVEEVTAV